MAAVRALSVVTSTLATWAWSGRTRYISAPPASTAEITGATPRRAASAPAASATNPPPPYVRARTPGWGSAASAPAASATSLAPSYVRAGTSVYESSAAAPAIAMASSSSGVSPLAPIAPMTSSPTFSGIPPVRHEAPCSASAPRRPPETCSSISRLGRTKIAAVRALSTATRELAICAPGVRRSCTSSPHGSTTASTTRAPDSCALRSAAASTAAAPSLSMILRILTMVMRGSSWLGSCCTEAGRPDRVVRGDEQEVAVGTAEGEVHGTARDGDLADERAGRVEDLDAPPARDVHAAGRVDLDAVRESRHRRTERPRVAEPATVEHLERDQLPWAGGVVVAGGMDGAAVADVERALVGREGEPVRLVEPRRGDVELAGGRVVAVDALGQRRRPAEALEKPVRGVGEPNRSVGFSNNVVG